jgi:acetyltransferase EpsM
MMPLWIFGSGGHAKVVIDTARMSGKFEVVGCLDDCAERWGQQILGVPIVGPISMASVVEHGVKQAIIAIGANAARHALTARFGNSVCWPTLVHPGAMLSSTVTPGEGTVIFAGAVVQADAQIGRHAILNTQSSIDHDSMIGDFSHVAPGAHLAGNVAVGTGAFIGIGASAIPGSSIGEWSIVGAGSTVTRDLPANTTAVGSPARVIRTHPPGWHLD